MDAVQKRLVRTDDKLIQLFDPPFDKGALQPGYIKGYVPGIRENGGQYTHAATWVVLATALQGRGDRAMELWNLINPIYHATTAEEVQHYKVEPYVVCADVYGAPPHTGRGGWTWYTGSASWLYRVAIETILGFQLRGGTLRIEPCIPPSWPGFELSYRHRVRDIPDSGRQLGWHGSRRAIDRAWTGNGCRTTQCRSATTERPTTSACNWADGEQRLMADTPGADDDLDRLLTDRDLGLLQFSTVLYYLHETNPDNGLVRDKTDPNAPVSIAAVGMALATIPVVVERGVLFRDFAAKITLKRLRYLLECPQGPEPDASGYKGFFYHFLDIETGRRVWECELSTIDSAFLFAGALTVGTYFDRDTPDEVEIRNLADTLYRRADWNWARDGGPTLTHGWRPENGFIQHR